jgi:protein tyrosine/serine phosphatase
MVAKLLVWAPANAELPQARLCIMRTRMIAANLLMALMCCGAMAETNRPNRPTTWATPMRAEGLSNLHKVSDRLYRSAQPSDAGMARVAELGIKTVVSLRYFHSDRTKLGNSALAYERIDMKAWDPEEEDIVRFLRLVADESRGPILVHCQHGADRTGMMCAIYRVAIQRWSKEEALQEMTEGGYNFHGICGNLITWFNQLDIEKIRKAAGIAKLEEVTTGPATATSNAESDLALPQRQLVQSGPGARADRSNAVTAVAAISPRRMSR